MNFEDYLRGKSVIIVGPAGYMDGCGYGDVIDSFDVVVRLNKALPISDRMREHVGTRCDVMYNAMDEGGPLTPKTNFPLVQPFEEAIPIWVACGVRWVCATSSLPARIDKFNVTRKGEFCFRVVARELYSKLAEKYKSFFNSGTTAIADLLQFPLRCLMIVGFTFYKDGVYKEYRTGANRMSLEEMKKDWKVTGSWHHVQEHQMTFLSNVFESDPRVFADSEVYESVGLEVR